MRLLPRSLQGRLALALLLGLTVAQLLSAAINLQERDQLLLKTSGMQSAQRIAETVLLLDSLDAAERKRIVTLLSVPPQVVSLDRAPLALGEQRPNDIQTENFSSALQDALGDQRQVRVAGNAAPALAGPRGPGYGRRRAMLEGKEFVPGMYRYSHDDDLSGGVALVAQVQLRDGQWVTFDTQVPKGWSSLPLRLLVSLGILLAAVLVLSFVAVRWIVRPLRALSAAADALGKDIHCPPLEETGPIEVKQAAHAFNTMQARLARFIEDRTRILAAMSHDLKTPITRLRLRADMLDDEPLRLRFEKDLLEMENMVMATLDFMRGIGDQEARQPVDVMALLESLQADCEEMGQKVRIDGHIARPYLGIAPQLKRCLANLLENAVLYGGEAQVIADDTPENLTIRVRDRGPGIPESELEKVFDPFHRLDSSRNRETGGTGLGLTIARSIAQSHGGNVTLRNLPEGGLEVVVRLPRVG
jgi:signal transduction histidine kinase